MRDFSGSASDDLEERLQVVCLPKLSRGVVYDVKEVGPGYGAYSQNTCGIAATVAIAQDGYLVSTVWRRTTGNYYG